MDIEFRRFTDFNRGIMYDILKDAHLKYEFLKSEINKNTRILRLTPRRGDNAEMALIQLV